MKMLFINLALFNFLMGVDVFGLLWWTDAPISANLSLEAAVLAMIFTVIGISK